METAEGLMLQLEVLSRVRVISWPAAPVTVQVPDTVVVDPCSKEIVFAAPIPVTER